MLQVPETSALTLCTIILHFKIISAFGYKIHLSQETALGRKRASGGEAKKGVGRVGGRHLLECLLHPEMPGWGGRAGGSGSETLVCPPGMLRH